MKILPALFCALALSVSGCVNLTPAETLQPNAGADLAAAGRLVAHGAAGALPLADEARALAMRLIRIGAQGAEPTIGVTSDGAIYVTGGGARVLKSTDKGKTWQDVADHSLPRRDMDPYIWIDPLTDRVYSAPLYVVCTHLMWSDDGGASWERNALGGCGLPAHDHQSLVTGPPPKGVSTDGYPNVLYYTYNSFRNDGAWVVRSFDGGKTWDLGQQVFPGDCQEGITGAAAVAPDGTVIIPKPSCEGLRVGVSKDAGATWKIVDINDAGMGGGRGDSPLFGIPFAANPGAAFDEANNGYVAYPGRDGRMVLSASTDGGATWTEPAVVTPPGVTATAFSALVAGDAGRVAIAYLATTADTSRWEGPEAQHAAPDAVWHLYVTFSTNANAPEPTFTTIRATPDDDPVQIGCIWQSGGASPCRNLLDFFDATERDGRVYLAYADGCAKCKTNEESRGQDLHVAVVDTGISLRDGVTLQAYE